MSEGAVVVHVDVNGSPKVVGRLRGNARAGREEAHFEYDATWLKTSHHRVLEPMLRLLPGPHASGGTMPLFGPIGDSAPDRWGRTLMRRAERERARREKREPRILHEMDFLLGVDDEVRVGAVRFAREEGGPFLGGDEGRSAIPSVDDLERVLAAVRAHEKDAADERQTELLLESGQLLGGSRAKATVRDRDGHLLIAKFPSCDDDRDMQRWEAVALTLARRCGIDVPAYGVVPAGGERVLLERRFDRAEGSNRRIPFVSMMGLLGAADNKSQSYFLIADVIRRIGSRPRDDLRQLWRRAVFTVLISDKDNHLRNHGLVVDDTGWRIAPAFDLVPTAQRLRPRELAISLDGVDDRATLEPLLGHAQSFSFSEGEARECARAIARETSLWREVAKAMRLPAGEIRAMRGAFEHDQLEEALR